VVTLPPISLYLTDYLPPFPGVVLLHARLKSPAKQLLLFDWSTTPAPHTPVIPPRHAPIPLWVWESLLPTGSTRCALEKATSWLTPHWTIMMPTHPAQYAPGPHIPSSMPSCPVPCPPIRHRASSKGSRTLPLRPLSGLTSNCLLPWMSLFAPLTLVSPAGCHRSPLHFTRLSQIRFFPLPTHPPQALEARWWLYTFLYFSFGCIATIIPHVGGTGYGCFFC